MLNRLSLLMRTSRRVALVGAMTLCACSAEEKPIEPPSAPAAEVKAPIPTPLPTPEAIVPSFTPDLSAVRECRDGLLNFYLRTYDSLLKSDVFRQEMEITRYDQLAHRMWVPETTTSRQVSLEALIKIVRAENLGTAKATKLTFPFFSDAHQYHRDQYSMIFSEMGLEDIGGFPLGQFALTAAWDWNHRRFSVRDDLPWTITLLSRYIPPGTPMRNGNGDMYTLDDLLKKVIAEPRAIAPENPTACYNGHVIYAVAAAVAAGYEEYRGDANRLLAAEIARAKEVCEPMQGVTRTAARVKLYGHLIEALYRGGERVFRIADYQNDLTFMIEALREEATGLRGAPKYEGPFDILTAAPHSIHGLDLLLAAYPAETPTP